MKRLVFLLLLAPLASAAFAQDDSLKNSKWNGIWDPTDPNCPCYSIQKQAEEEYKQMLAEEQRQKELAQKQEEEKQKQEELAKKQEEEKQKQEELAKKQEEEKQKQEELAKKQEEEKKKISDGGRPGDDEANESNPVNANNNDQQVQNQEDSSVTITNINGNTVTARFIKDTAQTSVNSNKENSNGQQEEERNVQVSSNPGNNAGAAVTDSSSVSSGGGSGSSSSGGGSYPSTGKTKTFKKKFRRFRHNVANKAEKIFPKRKKKRKLLDDCWH